MPTVVMCVCAVHSCASLSRQGRPVYCTPKLVAPQSVAEFLSRWLASAHAAILARTLSTHFGRGGFRQTWRVGARRAFSRRASMRHQPSGVAKLQALSLAARLQPPLRRPHPHPLRRDPQNWLRNAHSAATKRRRMRHNSTDGPRVASVRNKHVRLVLWAM